MVSGGVLDENPGSRWVGTLPGMFGLEIVGKEEGRVLSRMPVRSEFLAPNGYLHAASVIALADTTCGYGTMQHRPEGAQGFTTIELKCNYLGTVREGGVGCEATLAHGGRQTQVWDARVFAEATGKTIALFRCTQMLLYPKG